MKSKGMLVSWLALAALVSGCGSGAASRAGGAAGVLGKARGDAVVVGAILPRTGAEDLVRFGDRVLEGAELALAEHHEAGGRPVALRVVDDFGSPEGAAAALGMLEQEGAVAVIGPLLPDGMSAAARERSEGGPVLVGPLLPRVLPEPGVFALNAPDVLGAEALARYAVAAGRDRVALLYPRTEDARRQAEAFTWTVRLAGGEVVADVAYEEGTTTFVSELRRIVAARPQAVFIPAPEGDVPLIAPQIVYYGLAGTGAQVLGGEEWAAESVRRQVAARYLNGVVAATPVPPSGSPVRWQDFVAQYEEMYRRPLDSAYPALGYDAMRLILAALGRGDADAEDVARRFREIRDFHGATGVLSVDAGRIVRRPYLVQIEQGELVPVTEPVAAAPQPVPDAGRRD